MPEAGQFFFVARNSEAQSAAILKRTRQDAMGREADEKLASGRGPGQPEERCAAQNAKPGSPEHHVQIVCGLVQPRALRVAHMPLASAASPKASACAETGRGPIAALSLSAIGCDVMANPSPIPAAP